jgi:hypothetical protein
MAWLERILPDLMPEDLPQLTAPFAPWSRPASRLTYDQRRGVAPSLDITGGDRGGMGEAVAGTALERAEAIAQLTGL